MGHSVELQLNVQDSPTWALLLSGLSRPGLRRELYLHDCHANERQKNPLFAADRPSLGTWPHFAKVTRENNVCGARVECRII